MCVLHSGPCSWESTVSKRWIISCVTYKKAVILDPVLNMCRLSTMVEYISIGFRNLLSCGDVSGQRELVCSLHSHMVNCTLLEWHGAKYQKNVYEISWACDTLVIDKSMKSWVSVLGCQTLALSHSFSFKYLVGK